ncbi:hypothetical protein [Streptomyces antimicrobicus]|uniref:Integral membrane protein n=1 Tax=Streptomyces antimicrobicus TaxID=2883108 RepID=A0ABS8B8F1_9ACTN|nr:hypothetical protein [Streptomyces antimicrobicus]MCB5180889.1 hypothetical protein [Streptomyces antimicrobicus]
MTDTRAPLRCTRAAMFAAVCTAWGGLGHLFMSGRDIPLGGLLGAFAVTAVLAWFGTGRRRGPLSISAALLGVQAVLHLVFAGSQGRPAAGHGAPPAAVGGAPATSAVHHPPHTAHAPGGMPGTGGLADLADLADMTGAAGAAGGLDQAMADQLAHPAGHGGLGMIAAHVLAGLFCALWLARGEQAVFRLARALRALAVRLVGRIRPQPAAAVPDGAPRVRPRRHEPPRRLRGAVHAHAVLRRGPPPGPFPSVPAPGRLACA